MATAAEFNEYQMDMGVIKGEDVALMMRSIQPMLKVTEDGKCGANTLDALRAFYAPKTMPVTPAVKDWVPILEKYRGRIPLKFLENWITHASGGNPNALGIPGVEAGIFQTYHPDDDRYGQRACYRHIEDYL